MTHAACCRVRALEGIRRYGVCQVDNWYQQDPGARRTRDRLDWSWDLIGCLDQVVAPLNLALSVTFPSPKIEVKKQLFDFQTPLPFAMMSDTEPDSDKRILDHVRQRPRKFLYGLDNVNLETQCPLDNGKHSNEEHVGAIGALNLPLEITTAILSRLDLPSLTDFRRVNRCAMHLVDSLHQYQMVVKHCPNVLRAILSTNADSFDLAALYKTLSTPNCHHCARRARYLYLVTCKRVCAHCVLAQPLFGALTEGQLKELVRTLAMPELQDVPYIVSLPGRYGYFEGTFCPGRTKLFDY